MMMLLIWKIGVKALKQKEAKREGNLITKSGSKDKTLKHLSHE